MLMKEKKEMWFGDISKEIPEKINGITFPLNDLKKLKTISAYGKKFLAPSNPEKYLEKVYGESWKVPIKKQFFWKNKFK